MNEKKFLQIRNSTAEFLTFTAETGEASIEVLYANESVWATQDIISQLYGIDRSGVTKHLKNIFDDGELAEKSVCAKFARTASDQKIYHTKYYNLDAIIAVGFKVNSERAVQFRQWAIGVLRNYAVRGYVLDKAVGWGG